VLTLSNETSPETIEASLKAGIATVLNVSAAQVTVTVTKRPTRRLLEVLYDVQVTVTSAPAQLVLDKAALQDTLDELGVLSLAIQETPAPTTASAAATTPAPTTTSAAATTPAPTTTSAAATTPAPTETGSTFTIPRLVTVNTTTTDDNGGVTQALLAGVLVGAGAALVLCVAYMKGRQAPVLMETFVLPAHHYKC
jgi:hypothetical protein